MNERSATAPPSLLRVARVFAVLGTTSFGGGVVAYLRHALVESERWFDDREFVRLLELSQTLPGLNSVNMAVLAGDQLARRPRRGGRRPRDAAAGRRLRPDPWSALRALRQRRLDAGAARRCGGGGRGAAAGHRAPARPRPVPPAARPCDPGGHRDRRRRAAPAARLGRAGGGRGRDLALPAASRRTHAGHPRRDRAPP